MNWNEIVSKVRPFIVKIETPTAAGTGFLCVYNQDKSLAGIATALHVLYHAEEWQQSIRLRQIDSHHSKLLKENERFVFTDWKTDSAVIIFQKNEFPFPDTLLPLLPLEKPIDVGSEVGWLGFPSIDPYTLCFFSGNISAWREERKAYLIDGVAINGVSGGPVIYSTSIEGVQIVGIISAYRASRATGEALPGLSIAQDVSHFHDVVKHIRSMDEAKQKKEESKESEEAKAQKEVPSTDQPRESTP